MHVPAAAAAAGVGLTGQWLFDYNRMNYQNDVPQRFARFMTSRNMLNAQVGQYRQDIAGITTLTAGRMDSVQMVMTLILCVCAALSDAGRIGMHGAAPPQWLCALYSGHIYSAILYCGVALWLGMHGSLRAQCAAASLLTRKVRLPIPSLAQLDNARGFASSFEQQKFGDIFRVPFMRHPEAAPEIPPGSDGDSDAEEEGKEGKKGGKAKDAKKKKAQVASDPRTDGFNSTARDTVPSWIRDEQVVDKGGGTTGAAAPDDIEPHAVPDHFQMLGKAQEEWWMYDVYARIMMLYGVCQFLFAVCYYSIGTTTAELRGFWISWSLPMLFLIAQALILRLDILSGKGNHVLPHAEWLGHIAPYFAITATTLEYHHIYSPNIVVVTWVFVFLTYLGHLMLALRFLDLAWPDWNQPNDMPDEPGKPWWPSTWKVPSAFSGALWLLAPPKKLESGQHDLVHEAEALAQSGGGVACRRRSKGDKKGQKAGAKAKAGEGFEESPAGMNMGGALPDSSPSGYYGDAGGAYTSISPFQAFSVDRANDLPWQLTRVSIVTMVIVWIYMMVALFVEISVGVDTLTKPPGEPPWIRDQKMVPVWKPNVWHKSNMELPSNYRLETSTKAKYDEDAHATGGYSPDDILSPGAGMTGVSEGGDHSSGSHRRLEGPDGELIEDLLKAGDRLSWLLQSLEEQDARVQEATALYDLAPAPADYPQNPIFMAPAVAANAKKVSWPTLFEPQHLLCRGPSVAALTSRGFGAHIPELSEMVEAKPFALDGIGSFGPLAGAAWHKDGLSLVTKAGHLLACPGLEPEQGRWPCEASAKLPLPKGARLAAAAISESEEGSRMAAFLFEHLPGVISFFKENLSTWSPAGEVHLPEAEGHVGLSFDGQELLAVIGKTGAVHRRNIQEGTSSWHASPPPAQLPREFRSACMGSQETPGLLRLALHKAAPDQEAWVPELTES